MKHPYIQPFKYITVIMKEATNSGMGHLNPTDGFLSVDGDKRFKPVSVDRDGFGVITPNSDGTGMFRPTIGVLTESFDKPMVSTQVLLEGIVPLQCETAVIAGSILVAGADGKIKALVKTTGGVNPSEGQLIGIAMTDGGADEYIPVLIGKL